MTAAPLPVDFGLYLITDRHSTSRDLACVVEEALEGGVKAIQLREKDLSSRELFATACTLRSMTERYQARLLINDRVDIALAVGADGVHLGTGSIPVDAAREILGMGKLIGCSCHDRDSALEAQQLGADFITFGPVFATPSKAAYGAPVGMEKLSAIAALVDIPVFALGGINRDNAALTIAAGVHGIALISAVIAAESPRAEAAELLSIVAAQSRKL